MTAFYKELQAADAFNIRLPYPFSNYDRQLLTLLYQPMVGAESISLYLTLWAEGEAERNETPHYTLMNTLGMPIAKIFESRLQLEAIGLLKTYKKGTESRTFLYELCPPLDPKDFFTDPLLSMFLFSKIGDIAYRRVRDRFILPAEDMESYEEVSRTFTDIFQPVHAKAGYPNDSQKMQQRGRKGYEAEYDFDFSLLHQGLSEQLVPKRVLTAAIKDTICKLAFLYGWGPLEMQKVILLAIDDDYRLTIEGIKKSASEYYKMTVSTTAPKLEPVLVKTSEPEIEPKNRQDELILYLESASPVEVLRDIAGGKEPLSADVQLANNLVMQHGMEPAVVNVLLQYVLLRTDMKLTKGYVEKIASHWIRKNVSTVAEAMELARTEHAQYMKWKSEGSPAAASKNPSRSGGKPVREEKLPEWFYTKDEPQATAPQKNESLEVEKQKLLAKLALKKGKGD
ncbi:replication initiation and membrane attachment family protein [Planomicrobium sp. MB-3u-38]|uniref:replication initiation and membrane attachment family protein n=1 Tax=Planomicrobium sp. MB-3u-38 TaxID=2058318 RepID=UPI000C7AB903|nr:DnaD domain protein [Planomicrobium sp. MB-3u-38]PKH11426.1 helicase DnaB [Planomicrobium sp. MB-3u-38]